MVLYGILSSATNTGIDAELQYVFSTPLNIVSNQPAYVQDSINLKRKANSQNLQRWEIEANIVPSVGSPNFLVHSIVNGYDSVIYLRIPQIYGLTLTQNVGEVIAAGRFVVGRAYTIASAGSTSFTAIGSANNTVGTVFVATGIGSGTGTATANAIVVSANIAANTDTLSTAGVDKLNVGEFIKISSDPKVYLVVSPGVSGANIKVRPPLRLAIASGATITVGPSVTMRARYDNAVSLGVVYKDGVLMDQGSAKFIEALS
jgi:hypothetical protein